MNSVGGKKRLKNWNRPLREKPSGRDYIRETVTLSEAKDLRRAEAKLSPRKQACPLLSLRFFATPRMTDTQKTCEVFGIVSRTEATGFSPGGLGKKQMVSAFPNANGSKKDSNSEVKLCS